MNASIRPSGDRAGWITESGNCVSWTHSDRSTGRAGSRHHTAALTASVATTAAASAATRHRFHPRCAFSIVVARLGDVLQHGEQGPSVGSGARARGCRQALRTGNAFQSGSRSRMAAKRLGDRLARERRAAR